MKFADIFKKDIATAATILAGGLIVWEWWKNRNNTTETPEAAQKQIQQYDNDTIRVYWPKGSTSIISVNLKSQAKKFHDDLFSWYNDVPFARLFFYNTLHDDLAQVPDTKYARFKQLYVEQFGTTPDADALAQLPSDDDSYSNLKKDFPYL